MPDAGMPPGPKSWFYGSTLLSFRGDTLNFLQKTAREHGDISHFKLGSQSVYLFNHPDLIKDVLVTKSESFMKGRALQRSKRMLGEGLLTSEGDFHRRQRRLAQPAFQRQRLPAYGAAMSECAVRTADRWKDGSTFDVSKEMMRLTLAIVGKTLFDADVESEAQEIGDALNVMMQSFDKIFVPFSRLLEKLPLPQNRRTAKALARLDATIYRLIEDRRRSGEDRGDLLSMLLNARDTEGDGGGMSDKQLRDEAMTIFLAGHETTANMLSWTWYVLSKNPDAEAELHAELKRVLNGRAPTVEDIPNLRCTEAVISESMRLYPPAWGTGRMALKDYQVRDYKFPKGAVILISQYVTHRDERFFPDPERFVLKRWTPEAKESRHAYAYFPFGGGPRRCIGEGFAWMEGILLLATLAQRWKLQVDEKHVVTPHALITLRPKFGIKVKAMKRS